MTEISEHPVVQELTKFAATKPADEPYEYGDPYRCPLCQLYAGMAGISVEDLRFTVEPWLGSNPGYVEDRAIDGLRIPYPKIEDVLMGFFAGPTLGDFSGRTWGALLARLQAL